MRLVEEGDIRAGAGDFGFGAEVSAEAGLGEADDEAAFAGLPSPFEATCYHSLIVKRETLPPCLKITAETAEGEIMGLAHRDLPVYGVQFRPESILTQHGKQMLKNFLDSQKLKEKILNA